MNLPPIAATTVGSWSLPTWLGDTETETTFRLQGEQLIEGAHDATVLALDDQESCGLDLVTDGEQRRGSFVHAVLGVLTGVDVVNRHAKVIRRNARERQVPRIVGEVRRTRPILLDDLRFAKAHSTRPLKMAVPGPLTVVDTSYDEVYGDEARLAMDVAAALNAELLDLQAAGCDVLQIDEPAMTRWHEKVAAFGAEALDRCLDGITVPTLVHLCYGYPSGGGQHEFEYPELLAMLLHTRISGFSLEFARSGYDPAILRGCGDRLVMFGCLDPGSAPAPPLEAVVASVGAALEFVAPERLMIAPDCGLKTIRRPLARQKAELLVAAAAELRGPR